MARSSAFSFFFMALSSSLLLHPAFATKETTSSSSSGSVSSSASTAAPPPPGKSSEALAMILASQEKNPLTKDICELSSDPVKCPKILEGTDPKLMESLPAGTTTRLSIELSAAIAVRAVGFMTPRMNSQPCGCLENYQMTVGGFNGAYANFTAFPIAARKSLHLANDKIKLCESEMATGNPNCALPEIDQTNKLLRGVIKIVSKEMKVH